MIFTVFLDLDDGFFCRPLLLDSREVRTRPSDGLSRCHPSRHGCKNYASQVVTHNKNLEEEKF